MKKLNKKGFTLVELIAVIAILSILMILALPQVLDLYSSGVKNAFATQVRSIYKVSEENLITDQIAPSTMSNTITYCHDGSGSDKENLLDLSGNEEVYYKVVFVGGIMQSFEVKDANYSYSDTSEPKISEISVEDENENFGTADKLTITCE